MTALPGNCEYGEGKDSLEWRKRAQHPHSPAPFSGLGVNPCNLRSDGTNYIDRLPAFATEPLDQTFGHASTS